MATIPRTFTDPATVAALRSAAASSNDDYRAIVCVFLLGGADPHFLIHPKQGPNKATYDAMRGPNPARAHNPTGDYRPEGADMSLSVPLASLGPSGTSTQWGLAPQMQFMQYNAFQQDQLAIFLNSGYLKEPATRETYFNGRARRPEQLESHNTQQELWQALPAFEGLRDSGWMGRTGELTDAIFNPARLPGIAGAYSLTGRALQTQGYETDAMIGVGAAATGAIFTQMAAGDAFGSATFASVRDALRAHSGHTSRMHRTFAARVRLAMAQQAQLAASVANLSSAADTAMQGFYDEAIPFGTSQSLYDAIANPLRSIVRIIEARNTLGQKRQVFFVGFGGWDHHIGLIANAGPRYAALDKALFGAFKDALDAIGMFNNVTTIVATEFGRTLVVNGSDGTDHAWGGHTLVMGGSVAGGIYGDFDMTLGGPQDYTNQGRYIPITSAEQILGPILQWYGVPLAQLPLVLPNIARFPAIPGFTLSTPVNPATPATAKIDFMAGYTTPALDSRITFTPAFGPQTRFNAAGDMEIAPHNFVANTQFAGAAPGFLGAGGALPTGWSFTAPAGLLVESLGIKTAPNGVPMLGLKVSGTLAGAGTVQWTLGPTTTADLRGMYAFSAMLQRIDGPNNQAAPHLQLRAAARLMNGSTIVERVLMFPTVAPGADPAPIHAATLNTFTAAGATAVQAGFDMAISGGSYPMAVDCTVWIAQPHLCQSMLPLAQAATPANAPAFVPNPSTTAAVPPLAFDHDPATLRRVGFRHSTASRNLIVQSMFGSGVVPGTVGATPAPTWPSGWSATIPASPFADTNFVQVVGTGVERGISYIDIRLFGTNNTGSSGLVSINLAPFNGAGAIAATNSTARAFSLYARLLDGAIPAWSTGQQLNIMYTNTSGAAVATQGNAYGVASAGQPGRIEQITNAPLSTQRLAFSRTANDAATAFAVPRLQFGIDTGVTYDFTIRLGAPQLELNALPSAFIPTYGVAGFTDGHARGAHDLKILAAQFAAIMGSPTLVPASGLSFALKMALGTHMRPPAATYPQMFRATDASAGNDNIAGYWILDPNAANAAVAATVRTASTAVADLSAGSGAQFAYPLAPIRFGISVNATQGKVGTRGRLSAPDTSTPLTAGVINRVLFGADGRPTVETCYECVEIWSSAIDDATLTHATA